MTFDISILRNDVSQMVHIRSRNICNVFKKRRKESITSGHAVCSVRCLLFLRVLAVKCTVLWCCKY